MQTMALALILGWCLVAASRAQWLPRPSLSLHPSQGVAVGDTVTLRCHLPRPAAWVQFYQEGIWAYTKSNDKEEDVAEFSFITTREHAGTYWCQYEVPESVEASERSDRVELVVTDHSFPPPSISLHPEERVGTGTNVTIRCWNRENGAAFLLHKDGCSAPILRQDPDGGGTATFTLVEVTLTDAGTYRCSYRTKANPFVFSPLGDNVTLEVTPTPAPPGDNLVSRGNLVVAVVRGCAAALIFVLGIFFVVNAHSLWVQRDENPGGEGPTHKFPRLCTSRCPW